MKQFNRISFQIEENELFNEMILIYSDVPDVEIGKEEINHVDLLAGKVTSDFKQSTSTIFTKFNKNQR